MAVELRVEGGLILAEIAGRDGESARQVAADDADKGFAIAAAAGDAGIVCIAIVDEAEVERGARRQAVGETGILLEREGLQARVAAGDERGRSAEIEAAAAVMEQFQFGDWAMVADWLAAQPRLADEADASAQLRGGGGCGQGNGGQDAEQKALSRALSPPAKWIPPSCPARWRAHR